MKKRIALLSLIAIFAISELIFIIVNTNNESEIVSSCNKFESADTNEEDENKKVNEMLTFKDFLGESDVEVTKIKVMNGDGDSHLLTDEGEINHIMNFLNDLKFKDMKKENENKGFDYAFIIYLSNDEHIWILPLIDKWDIDGKFYKVSKLENSKYSIGTELQKIKSRL